MKSRTNFKISFEELSRRGSKILAKQSPISFAKALEQVQLLKVNSKVGEASKKNRTNCGGLDNEFKPGHKT